MDKRKHRYNWRGTIIDYFKKASQLLEEKAFAIESQLTYGNDTPNRKALQQKALELKTRSADYETIATRITQSGIPIYREGYGTQIWEYQNRFNPDYAKKYNWKKTLELKGKFRKLEATHDFYLLTVCLKQIEESELTAKTNELKEAWQPLKYELQKYFSGAYGMIEFDYGFTTIDGATKTTYTPHAHYWLTAQKNTPIDTDTIQSRLEAILGKQYSGIKTSVDLHRHYNAVEKAGYVHKWLFIGTDHGNELDAPLTQKELIQNAHILIAIYEASKSLRPFYYGILSNRKGRIYNKKIKENKTLNKTVNKVLLEADTVKQNKDTNNAPKTDKPIRNTTDTAKTLVRGYFWLLVAIIELTRRIREKPK